MPGISSSENSVLVLAGTPSPSQIEGDIMYLHALLEANLALYLDELQIHLLSEHQSFDHQHFLSSCSVTDTCMKTTTQDCCRVGGGAMGHMGS